jgi:hypothetical protein
MTEPNSAQDLFKGRHFDQEIIILCVRWYLAFKLSSRDLVQMMAERGILLAHTTILRWVQRYVPDFEKRWLAYALPVMTRGAWTRLISRYAANGFTSTGPSIRFWCKFVKCMYLSGERLCRFQAARTAVQILGAVVACPVSGLRSN